MPRQIHQMPRRIHQICSANLPGNLALKLYRVHICHIYHVMPCNTQYILFGISQCIRCNIKILIQQQICLQSRPTLRNISVHRLSNLNMTSALQILLLLSVTQYYLQVSDGLSKILKKWT